MEKFHQSQQRVFINNMRKICYNILRPQGNISRQHIYPKLLKEVLCNGWFVYKLYLICTINWFMLMDKCCVHTNTTYLKTGYKIEPNIWLRLKTNRKPLPTLFTCQKLSRLQRVNLSYCSE